MHPLSFLVHEESRRYIIFAKIQLKSIDFALKTADFWWFKQNFIQNCLSKCRIWISQAQRTVFSFLFIYLFIYLFFYFLFFFNLLIACSKISPKVFTKLHDTSCKIPNFPASEGACPPHTPTCARKHQIGADAPPSPPPPYRIRIYAPADSFKYLTCIRPRPRNNREQDSLLLPTPDRLRMSHIIVHYRFGFCNLEYFWWYFCGITQLLHAR